MTRHLKYHLTTLFTTLTSLIAALISQSSLNFPMETPRRWIVWAQVDLACQLKPTIHVNYRLSAVQVQTLSIGTSQFSMKKNQPFFQCMMAKVQFCQ